MFTTCPKCALTLAVTAADLRAGQGYVRCGRCANVFNALLGLAEESSSITAALTVPVPAPAPMSAPAAAVPPVRTAVQTPPPSPPSPPAMPFADNPPRQPATSQGTEVTESRGTGSFETIVLEGDTFLQTEEMVTEETFDDEVAAVSRRIAAAHEAEEHDEEIIDFSDTSLQLSTMPAPVPSPTLAPAPTPAPAPAREWRSDGLPRARRRAPAAPAPPLETLRADRAGPDRAAPKPPRPARTVAGWVILAAVPLCALLLAAQLVDHWRNDLATHQSLSGPLGRLYSALDRPLTPNWNLAAYDLRQLGASSDANDQRLVRVRLSLSNHAPTPQAVPLLRITLLDRYGKRISAGELAPAQYLPATLRSQQLLDAEQRVDTEVVIPDPSQQASSFELDVCIAAAGGGLRCAGDSTTLAANGVVS